jgi:two-component system sensor histidine kinase/response regulator
MNAQNLQTEVVLDVAQALQRIGDDSEIYAAVAEAFLSDTPLLLASLNQAVGNNDAIVATRMAHSMKSSALTVGAMRLGAVAAALEALLMKGVAMPSSRALVQRVEYEVPKALEALKNYLHQ